MDGRGHDGLQGIGGEHAPLLGGSLRGEPGLLHEHLLEGRDVGIVDEAAAGLAGDAGGGARRGATGAGHHAHAVVALVEAADGLAALALDADRIVRDHRLLAVQQMQDDLQDLVLVDRTAVGVVVDLDGGVDAVGLLGVEVRHVGIGAVHELLVVVLMVLERVDAAGGGALAVRDDDRGPLADLLEPLAIALTGEAALDEGDVDRLRRLLRHGLAELHDVDVVAGAPGRAPHRSWSSRSGSPRSRRSRRMQPWAYPSQNASRGPRPRSNANTGPSTQTYLSLIWQWPHLPTPHFIRRSRSTKMFSWGTPTCRARGPRTCRRSAVRR